MSAKKTMSSKTSSARRKGSSGAKSAAAGAARGRTAAEERARIRLEIISITLIAVGVFLLVVLFSDAAGILGDVLYRGLSGVCGPMARAMPFFLIVYGIFLIVGIVRDMPLRRVMLVAAIFILLCIVLAGKYIEVHEGIVSITGGEDALLVFEQSVAGSGGGVLGTYIAKGIITLIGIPGLYILCIALIVISGILLAGMPMLRAAESVRDRNQLRREGRQKRIDERRALQDEAYLEGSSAYAQSGSLRPPDTFAAPSFLGGKTTGRSKASSGTDKQRHILDAVKNDEIYGDFSRPRGLEIEDSTIPFVPDLTLDEPDDNKPDTERKEVKAYKEPVIKTEDASLGKRKAGDMHYGASHDESNYIFPPIDLLSRGKGKTKTESPAELKANASRLEQALRDFRVDARVAKVTVGPTVTRYEVEPDVGVKIQSIRSLEPDLALKLEVKSVRVVPMPGQSVIGIEAYNANTSIVTLRDMIDSDEFRNAPSKISFALGKNISGRRIIVDLKEMPHLLIAGTTGSGKSVCINSILLSILYLAKPSEVKLILIDPKVVELKSFNDLPHLLVPVVTEPERAAMALSYAVTLMNDRYKKFAEYNVRNLESYNERMRKDGAVDEVMPQIIIVIDELSDLMMVASAKVQESISRLAAMARAAGMHLIVATQQPLASILTSVIKANIPSRIAFAVASNSSSRVILDNPGAERLHGKGDMLFSPVGVREVARVQGAFVEESEVIKVVNHVKKQMDPDYSADIMSAVDSSMTTGMAENGDEFFLDAVEMLVGSPTKQVSVSMLQRRFRIGYNRAARLVDMMEERGIVAASDGTNKPRRLIMGEAQLNSFLASAGQGAFYNTLSDESHESDSQDNEIEEEQAVTYNDLDNI